QHVVNPAHDPEITIAVTLRAVACQVIAFELRREIALPETVRIAPNRTNHARPRPFHHQKTALASLNLLSSLINNRGLYARQRQGARTGLERGNTWQRRNHVRACFRLP